jgi:hypothetical protein
LPSDIRIDCSSSKSSLESRVSSLESRVVVVIVLARDENRKIDRRPLPCLAFALPSRVGRRIHCDQLPRSFPFTLRLLPAPGFSPSALRSPFRVPSLRKRSHTRRDGDLTFPYTRGPDTPQTHPHPHIHHQHQTSALLLALPLLTSFASLLAP